MNNPYEEKFKQQLQRVKDSLERRSQTLKNHTEKINDLIKHITALNASLDLCTNIEDQETKRVTVEALKERIEVIESQKKRAEHQLQQEHVCLNSDSISYNVIKSLCPHVDTEYDHTDYHKSEDFHKCKLCGTVL